MDNLVLHNNIELVREINIRDQIRRLTLIFCSVLAVSVIGFVLYGNFAPMGVIISYDSRTNREISPLSPKNRVLGIQVGEEEVTKMTDDLVYFTTDMRYQYDSAVVKVFFQNTYPEQELFLGFQDQDIWHYESKIIDSPILNDLDWPRSGTNSLLYQRFKLYDTFDQFLASPPRDSIIGIYNYNADILKQAYINLPDYKPSQSETVINTPLRGRHTLYAYLSGEPFRMKIAKQDLNWYDEPDILKIIIYKENDPVFQAIINDDGITDSSHKKASIQEAEIRNPGPELPEPGVYKIVLDQNDDTVVKSIRTNLSKIVFESPVFTIANHEVYPQIADKTEAVSLVTDALQVKALTYHPDALQTIAVGDKRLPLLIVKEEAEITTPDNLSQITIPKSDVILKGMLGYFAFEESQFFRPTPLYLLPVSQKADLELADFILSDYIPSQKEGDWKVAQRTYDLTHAVVKNGKLSWLLKAPKIRENGREITIRKIEIEFRKNPLFN